MINMHVCICGLIFSLFYYAETERMEKTNKKFEQKTANNAKQNQFCRFVWEFVFGILIDSPYTSSILLRVRIT